MKIKIREYSIKEKNFVGVTGLPMYAITIGKDSKTSKKSPLIVITSRVHSGETPGSNVFEGILNFITSDC